ncbi:signal recognition particle protein [Erysipelotrichaceae bacterium]|nr:signal recognition particle protein [Erysipelotrichaceae bacterium]
MAFEQLSERLQDTFKTLGKKGKISEDDIKTALKEVRFALLEADVNYLVVKAFMKTISEKAEGMEIWKQLSPSQQVIQIVHDELKKLMGSEDVPLNQNALGMTSIMLVGLQGSGKTTLAAKLAYLLKKKPTVKPFFIAADVYRPAAIDQLKTLAVSVDIPVFELGTTVDPVEIVRQGLDAAKQYGATHVIIDTAGRIHLDEVLMEELVQIKKLAQPTEIMLVIDAMTGQDAVNVAINFHDMLTITGVTLTKLDGDARGGAALSVRSLTNVPIKFVGVSEKIDGLEIFHPDRMADRILGMGDVVSLIEKAQSEISEEDAEHAAQRMFASDYNLEDFLSQMQQMKKMGPIDSLLGMIPGMNKAAMQQATQSVDDKKIGHTEAIIHSMTIKERKVPTVLNASRKKRIASGSGRTIQEINQLLKQFDQSKTMMRRMGQMMQGGKNPLESMSDLGGLMQSLGGAAGGRGAKRQAARGSRRGKFPF